MDKEQDNSLKYVSEFVWLPTYIAVAVSILVVIDNSNIAAITMLLALIGTRMIFELIYRLVLGKRRLLIRNGIVAFTCQVVVWASIWLLLAGQMM